MPLPQTIVPSIAMLHSVKDQSDDLLATWCISRKAFIRLLDVIEERRFTTTHFAELSTQTFRSFSQTIILSFDDCAKHLFDYAVPELRRRSMKAVFYMPTAYIGGYNAWDVEKGAERLELMNEADLKDLVQMGMEVGAHSHHHIDLKALVDTAQLQQEVEVSKQLLENITGQSIVSFAYPYGAVPANYKMALGTAGYHYGVGIYQPFQTKLALRRFGVYEKDTPTTLHRKLSRPYQWMRSLYDAVKK